MKNALRALPRLASGSPLDVLIRWRKKINELFTGLWSVRIGKNCDLGLNMLTSA